MSVPRESKRTTPTSADPRGTGVAGPQLSPGLYLVATPIGNAADVTLRALDVLARADAIACEDTRQTRKLMEIHAVPLNGRRLIAYHDRNGAAQRPRIMALLGEGLSVAYCSDAGTPMIADPGYRLVEEAREAGFGVHAVPGASAVMAALVGAGLPTDRFLFAGFLPPKSAARQKVAAELAGLRATLVFFESPRRLAEALADLAAELGPDRPAAVARELTKKFEEMRHGTLAELAERYGGLTAPKGEVVLLVGPPVASAAPADRLDEMLTEALATASPSEAARTVAAALGLPRRQVYQRAQELKDG